MIVRGWHLFKILTQNNNKVIFFPILTPNKRHISNIKFVPIIFIPVFLFHNLNTINADIAARRKSRAHQKLRKILCDLCDIFWARHFALASCATLNVSEFFCK